MTTATFLQHLVRQLRQTAETPKSACPSDVELLQRFQRFSDPDALEMIVRRYGNCVLSACRKVLTSEADVEDAFQATFVVLLQSAHSIRQGQALGGWLSCVAHRVALKALANASRRQRVEQCQQRLGSTEPDLSWREACAILHEELDRLPDQYRLPLILCYLDGKSRDEAALQLDVTPDALRGRLARGRERLRNRLLKRGIALSAGLLALVANSGTAGGPPEQLLRATLEAALSGRLSATVAALLHGAVPSMTIGKFKLLAVAVLAVGMISSVGWWLVGAAPPSVQLSQDHSPRLAAVTAAPEAAEVSPTPDEKKTADPAKTQENEPVVISGRVLAPDGKPFVGAKLFVTHPKNARPWNLDDIGVEQVGTSGEDGRFKVAVKKPASQGRSYLIVHADGAGVDFLEVGDKRVVGDVMFQLVKDQSITGRVVNTEGKPVAGVTVGFEAIYVPAENKLDDYLAGWKKNWRDTAATPEKRLYLPLDAITGSATTDKDGRFKLTGAGAERIAHVSIHGNGIAKALTYVITRAGFDPKPYNEAAHAQVPPELRTLNQLPSLNGPELTVVTAPGKTIEGVARDAATGKPLADIRLAAFFGFGDGTYGVTDKDGKYRLEGLPQEKIYRVLANPPEGSPYLRRIGQTEGTPGTTAIRFDFELVKGVVVTGQVIDKQTGKGVESGIRFASLSSNKYIKKPGFDGYKTDGLMEGTDKEGRFKIATIPGQSLVMVQTYGREMVGGLEICPYRTAVPDPDHKDLFKYEEDDDTWLFNSARGLELLNIENVVKVVDLKENGGEVKVELKVDRGRTTPIAIQDADGKPLAGVVVSGLTAHWPITYKLNEATATVFALNPDKPRRLVFLHPERKLGGTAIIRGDEKEPVVVKLQPLGAVTARFLDGDGGALAGAVISVNCPDTIGSELYRYLDRISPAEKTDKNGRFTLAGVVPGMKFYLQTKQGDTYYTGEPKIGLREVEAGKTLDLGECKMKPQR